MGEVEGLEAVKNFFGYWASNFCHVQLESIGEFTDRNNVFIQWKCKGDRAEKPSNEKEVAEFELHAMNRSQFKDGKVIRFWFYFNL